jgi:hypothetical protein
MSFDLIKDEREQIDYSTQESRHTSDKLDLFIKDAKLKGFPKRKVSESSTKTRNKMKIEKIQEEALEDNTIGIKIFSDVNSKSILDIFIDVTSSQVAYITTQSSSFLAWLSIVFFFVFVCIFLLGD